MASAAHCIPAGRAISRDLDGHLSWRERRHLRAHLRSCGECASFAHFQREQRVALRSLRLIAVPISLQVFRPAGF
jgi:anti-sigma factor RsiW